MKPILTARATFPRDLAPALCAGALLLATLAAPVAPAQAQPTQAAAAEGQVTLELKAAADAGGACQLTLVVTNTLETGLKRAAWQVAVFDKAGTVQGLPILDFGTLLPGKTRVVQFALPDRDCGGIGRIVVNDVAECTGQDGSDQRMACLTGLATRNRSDIEFGL
ncbi:hypothetical protein SAMN04488021_11330 [Paracoccus aminovorans]|uniref:Tat pathway signal protein n=1 Tax=Paracoccus aminovorans TaxID=34004 RepID=A0A1I3AAM4_9RHOB|nr:hypothetical protein [Paracoccus aminovorans]SFH46361.1 hypothetical protein SAMN04488021_11330 [Paracoccus aminovorans]